MDLDDKEYPRVEYLARFNVHNIYATYKRVDIGPPWDVIQPRDIEQQDRTLSTSSSRFELTIRNSRDAQATAQGRKTSERATVTLFERRYR